MFFYISIKCFFLFLFFILRLWYSRSCRRTFTWRKCYCEQLWKQTLAFQWTGLFGVKLFFLYLIYFVFLFTPFTKGFPFCDFLQKGVSLSNCFSYEFLWEQTIFRRFKPLKMMRCLIGLNMLCWAGRLYL